MTVSGILSGLTNPLGMGYMLSRAAMRVQPAQPADAVRGRAPTEEARHAHDAESAFDPTWSETPDTVELSPAAERAAEREAQPSQQTAPPSERELTEEEQARVEELKQRDAEVRQHEQAHISAAGSFAQGGAAFEYETGPDGQRYAIGGEVQIDVSPVRGDPEATIRKMETVRAAALAPADPSAQDQQVAAKAMAAIREAQAELTGQSSEPADQPADRVELSPAAEGSDAATAPVSVLDAPHDADGAASRAASKHQPDTRFRPTQSASPQRVDTYA